MHSAPLATWAIECRLCSALKARKIRAGIQESLEILTKEATLTSLAKKNHGIHIQSRKGR